MVQVTSVATYDYDLRFEEPDYGTVFYIMIAFISYHDKPLIFVGAKYREKLVSHHRPASV